MSPEAMSTLMPTVPGRGQALRSTCWQTDRRPELKNLTDLEAAQDEVLKDKDGLFHHYLKATGEQVAAWLHVENLGVISVNSPGIEPMTTYLLSAISPFCTSGPVQTRPLPAMLRGHNGAE